MFERLKAKWNINSNVQLIIIFIVFAITGSLSLQITKPILIYIGVMLLDPSVSSSYVEDCEVCCNPIQVTTTFQAMELEGFEAAPIEQ